MTARARCHLSMRRNEKSHTVCECIMTRNSTFMLFYSLFLEVMLILLFCYWSKNEWCNTIWNGLPLYLCLTLHAPCNCLLPNFKSEMVQNWFEYNFFWFRFIYSFKESKGLFLRRRIHTVMTQLLATATHQLLALSSFWHFQPVWYYCWLI